MSDKIIYTCSGCGKEAPAHKVERVGLKKYCSECADDYMIDEHIKNLVTVPGKS